MHEGDDSIDASDSSPRYAAVVAIVPLVTVGCANTSPAFRNDPLVKQYWYNVYGKAVSTEQAAARAISPLHRLNHLHKKSRLLLVHGEKDPRVPREHGDQVAAEAFKERGLSGAHLTYAREGHSIRREPNVLHLWHIVEAFLCDSLGLPKPPEADSKLTEGNTCTVHWDSVGVSGSTITPSGRPIILFDGVCLLCSAFIHFVLDHDKEGRYDFAPLQGPTAKVILEKAGLPLDVSTVVVVDEKGVHTRSTAALRVLDNCGRPYSLLHTVFIWLPSPLRDAGYKAVAAVRYRVFGKDDGSSCRRMTKAPNLHSVRTNRQMRM